MEDEKNGFGVFRGGFFGDVFLVFGEEFRVEFYIAGFVDAVDVAETGRRV